MKEDFPAPYYFDHVIACVPDAKDTIWLECTSQTISAGFMGYFTGDRKALMVTDTGGAVVYTPRYPENVNLQIAKVEASVSDDGTLVAEVNTTSTGLQEEDEHDHLHYNTQKERDEYYNHKYDLPTYKAENINYKETPGRIPSIDEHVTITSPNYASITGKRLFIKPNLFNREKKLPVDKPRKFDIVRTAAYTDIDSISIIIPKGYTVETMPKNVSINSKFGVYAIEYKVKENTILLVRKHIQSPNRYPASDYLELAKFYEEMSKADYARMVFVKGI